MEPIDFQTHPSRYRHWRLELPTGDDKVARLFMQVDEAAALRPGYQLKLNSYDLSVDIELADAIQRLRFEAPHVRSLIITSGRDRIFCAGANIHMLAQSTHPFKVNFCKYTNETRLYLEELSASSGVHTLAACNGPTAGGGYELALACDEIYLIDDGSSTVSLPEVPLLGVLPGTGGLTRVVDKRRVRRDRADVFSTIAEGMRGKRAVEWNLVDKVVPRSKWQDQVTARARELAATAPAQQGPGINLSPLTPTVDATTVRYQHVDLELDPAHRTATLTVRGPSDAPPSLDKLHEQADGCWALRAFRELDDALLRLRFFHGEIGLVVLRSRGDAAKILAHDAFVAQHRDQHWLVREIALHQGRVLRRLDNMAKSLFAVLDPESAWAGVLLEVALAADRRYALDDAARPIHIQASAANDGRYAMWNHRSRLDVLTTPGPTQAEAGAGALFAALQQPTSVASADELGLITVLADEIDFDDTLRMAIEERAAISPDALTGMEASFRCIGGETIETKIFGRLTAWQNWIFSRPNSVGEKGALSLYGQPERPSFDWRRT